MSLINLQRDSSPDPLASSQNTSSPVKARSRRIPPRKALSTTAGNIQAHDIRITASALNNPPSQSMVKKEVINENEQSPWQIRITVQAEQNTQQVGSSIPQCSPSKRFAERTFTTTVPLRAEDKSSPVRRNSKGTPRKSRKSLANSHSPSKSPVNRSPKVYESSSVNSYAEKSSSPSPKRGRGRPRKSVDTSGLSSPCQDAHEKNASQALAPSSLDRRQKSPRTVAGTHSNTTDPTNSGSPDLEDQHGEFDSIIESEGFSMVSVSSLPSAQGSSGMAAGFGRTLRKSPRSLLKRHVTPSDSDYSPLPPPPPKVEVSQQSTRELSKPTSGTPRLARVVRAGIALQGVLSPARRRHNPANLAPWLNHSSPMSSTTSPKERLDQLFNGFGPGTCRELRAGLRLGEELAKRQHPEIGRSDYQANEDVFAPKAEIRYPDLPVTDEYSLKIPDAVKTKSPSLSNPQLPSPARSDETVDDDKMSWKFDTMQSNAVKANLARESAVQAGSAGDKLASVDHTMLQREALYQQEREAISKQIQDANPSQVVVIDSDDEDEVSVEATYEDDGDIWQEEAQNSDNRPSSSDVPPLFLQNEPRKPRRSQLPSPWMRKTQDIQSSSPVTNDSDLFWQPNQARASCKKPKSSMQKSVEHTRLSNPSLSTVSALNADGANDEVKNCQTHKDTDLITQLTLPASTSKEKTSHGSNFPQRQSQTILKPSINHSDSEDSTSEAEGSDGSLTDDDEDIESTLLSHHFMQDEITSPIDESTQAEIFDVDTPTSSKTGIFEEIPEPRTPSCLARTPKASSSKKVRFTPETKQSDSLTDISPLPLPPAPSSWFTRVTSLLLTWNSISSAQTSTAAAASIPLPTKRKKIIKLPDVDTGPLPSYMPWLPSHWWALIHITRQIAANPSAYPYDAKSLSASWLGAVVSVNGWKKKITKEDCVVVERFMRVLYQRGAFKGVEDALVKGGNGKQWGKAA
ncbi:MAG: hypothetical protein LQ337_007590, partial [Flavoplaca oasis]